jgi:hypothetical protein
VIATLTATIRAPVDHPTIDNRETSLGTRLALSRSTPFRIF